MAGSVEIAAVPAFKVDEKNSSQRWKKWLRSFELYLVAKNIKDPEQKKALLLHCAGEEVQDIYFSMEQTFANDEETDTFQNTVEMLNKHFIHEVNVTYERHVFRNMKQEPEESISLYVIRLRNQARLCSFGENENDQIRDQVVEKCMSNQLRKKFLEKGTKLTLSGILRLAQVWESTEKQASEMEKQASEMDKREVNSIKNSKGNTKNKKQVICFRCGKVGHYSTSKDCEALNVQCKKCNKKGHFAKQCRTKTQNKEAEKEGSCKNKQKKKVFKVDNDDSSESENYAFSIYSLLGEKISNETDVMIGNIKTKVIIDSGASCNVMGRDKWEKLKKQKVKCVSEKSDQVIRTYGNCKPLSVIGKFNANVVSGLNTNKQLNCEFLVVNEHAKIILGLKSAVELGLLQINDSVNYITKQRQWIEQFPQVFTDDENKIGKLKDYQVKITIDENIKPIAQNLRRVPYNLKEKVKEQIDRLLKLDIIEKINEPSEWISNIVLVPKHGDKKDYRLCVDMRNANKGIIRERHQLPTIEETLQELEGASIFSKLDIKWAYHQLELSPESRPITTFSTHLGLFRYKRLMFGINSGPEKFQKVLQQILSDCDGVVNYLDDIIVSGKNKKEHDERMSKVLKKFEEKGITLNPKKCSFGMQRVKFLGHEISRDGIKSCAENRKTILEFRQPKNVGEVQSFLGLVNFSARFIPDMATINEPLRKLLKKDTKFKWGKEEEEAFLTLKQKISNPEVLGFYRKGAETSIWADASPVGLGAVLAQIQDNVPKVISYASRSLTEVEQRYSQTEKEALAIVWACERFRMYLIGTRFNLYTDHKPLEFIFSVKSRPSARIERWVLRLQQFNYNIVYIKGKTNIADSLSRLLKIKRKIGSDCIQAIVSEMVPKAVTLREIEKYSKEDVTLLEIRKAINSGIFPTHLKLYDLIKREMCVVGDLVLRGDRLLVPNELKNKILEIGHEGHPGICAMKQRLRTKVWWPKMNKDVETFCKTCPGCQLVQKFQPIEPVIRTKLPSRPWEYVAIDFLGPMPTKEYICVIVDYYSRFIEAKIMTKITTEKTIAFLKELFARYGIPTTIQSDNGPQFISKEMREFILEVGVKHHRITPLWPQANGEIERQNRTIVKRLKIFHAEGKDWKTELNTFLFMYRTTPHTVTGIAPSELFFRRKIQTKLPMVIEEVIDDEEIRDRDTWMKEKGKQYIDETRKAKISDIKEGDTVLLKEDKTNKLSTNFKPTLFTVNKRIGNSVILKDPDGKMVTRNSSFVTKFKKREDKQISAEGKVKKEAEKDKEKSTEPAEMEAVIPEANSSETRERITQLNPPMERQIRPVRMKQQPTYLKDYVLDL